MHDLKPVPTSSHGRRTVFVHPELSQCTHVFLRHDAIRKAIQPPYDGPFAVIKRSEKLITLQRQGKEMCVSIDRPNCGGLNRRSVRQLTELPRHQSSPKRRRHAEYMATQRAAETPVQSQTRRLQQATYMASQRDTETIEAAESRKRAVAERAQQRRLIFTRNTSGVFDKAAFEYDETFDYESQKLIKLEAMNKECRFCVGICRHLLFGGGESSPSFNRRAS
ncbi:retrovirus-related Pol polyprotein from transposon 412 [Trichonephila clavipes]|nr:retrovirus-related Pol polyprotein from transposon 412 [Trichonephila clavipes]